MTEITPLRRDDKRASWRCTLEKTTIGLDHISPSKRSVVDFCQFILAVLSVVVWSFSGAVRPESITNLAQKIGPSHKDVTAGSE
jgi:hypothetical protein